MFFYKISEGYNDGKGDGPTVAYLVSGIIAKQPAFPTAEQSSEAQR